MTGRRLANNRTLRGVLCAGVAACAVLAATPVLLAQTAAPEGFAGADIPDDARLLLSADELIYNNDRQTVIAQGAVRIDYGGYRMVAQRVVYDRRTGRMKAFGAVELINPEGQRFYADELDVTDDFSSGFANALRIETTDNTRFAAESAERRGGVETRLNQGVYTACEICRERPDRPPLWQIKAERVIDNAETRTVTMRNARFEFLGIPLAFLPYLELPSDLSRRKSGFLSPTLRSSDQLGYGASVPYYWRISPHMDATFTATGYTRQGFLGEAEFRQRFHNGFHTLKVAGIDQREPDAFRRGSSDEAASTRGFVASTARFEINPRWTFGWDVMAQSDNNFAYTYDLEGYDEATEVSEIYLNGLDGRNFFDLRGYRFDIQDGDPDERAEEQQPLVHPVFDYSRIHDDPVLGGQLSLTVNETSLTRDRLDVERGRIEGLEGTTSRISSEVEWQRRIIAPGGLVLTPLVAGRADAFFLDVDDPALATTSGLVEDGTETRTMVTAGLEASYPILATTSSSSHVIEPVGQIFVRPDEELAGGLPNEDAQAFVFDATRLFSRDKFAGFDRVEGGTRANVGLRYTGSFDGGTTLHGVFGQSYHIAGLNSFAADGLARAGADSGLESDVSDFVGLVGVDLSGGLSLSAGGRFDEEDFSRQRTDFGAAYDGSVFDASVLYSQIAPQPTYGKDYEREEVSAAAGLQFTENWTVFGNVTYDLRANDISRDGIGLRYADECFIFQIDYAQEDSDLSGNDWSVNVSLSFRTLGDIGLGSGNAPTF